MRPRRRLRRALRCALFCIAFPARLLGWAGFEFMRLFHREHRD